MKTSVAILKNRDKIRIFQFLLFALLTVSEYSQAQQQWYQSNVPRQRHVNSLKFLGPEDILFGGGNEFFGSLQELWLSHDKSLEWGNVNSVAGQPWIKSMAFIDTLQGFAVGDSGTILKTVNGANFWTELPKPIIREFNKIIYVTPQTMYIVGGTIPRQLIFFQTDLDTLQTIVKSTDGGNTWNVVLDRQGFWLHGVDFTDTLHGIAVGDEGTILKTTDGGVHWSNITPPVIRDFKAVKFINSSIGYITGGNNRTDSLSTILRTTNGGDTWSVLRDEVGGILNDITFTNDSTGYIVGSRSTLLKTTNRGLNWIENLIPGANKDKYFNCVEFRNDSLGMIGANDGYMYVYTTSSLASAYTLGYKYNDTGSYTILGGVNTHGEIATHIFYYSLDSTLTSKVSPFYLPEDIKSDSIIVLAQGELSSLLPDTTYYYTIQTHTLAGYAYGDTLSFFTKKPEFIFQTLPVTDITTSGATLKGLIEKLPSSALISFEYGISPAFDNEVAAVPGSINDTLIYVVSAVLNTLQGYKVYYYRLKVAIADQIYYGDIQHFFTGPIYKTFETLSPSHINIPDQTVTLHGVADKFRIPVTLSFLFGTSPFPNEELIASPFQVSDTLKHDIFVTINNLTPDIQYYYQLKGQTALGTFLGDIISFNSNINYSSFNTAQATGITNTSATINGMVDKISFPVALSFEYGTTEAFGNTIAAIPASINDTLTHTISATLNGLENDKIYYFRLKGTTGGIEIYGITWQFFTGYNEIPNWDFQDWQTDTVNIPQTWNFFKEKFERVPGHGGNYALKASGQMFFINSLIGDELKFFNGVPINFTESPDSVVFYLNYYVEPGDTAAMMLIMKGKEPVFPRDFYPITDNSNGVFKRMAYKINYDSLFVPDTIMMGFVTTIIDKTPNNFVNNYLIIDDISFLPGNNVFANSDFENWFPSIIEKPNGWEYIKYIALDTLDPKNNHVVSKVYFDPPNDYAAEIKNINYYQQFVFGGELSTNDDVLSDHKEGFPVKGKHRTFNGYYKFFPSPDGDSMNIRLDMRKEGTVIGQAEFSQQDSVPEFTPFSIPINYSNETDIPDTAYVQFLSSISSNPKTGTRLIIDKLSFDGFVVGVPRHNEPEGFEAEGLKVYPNPARDHLIVENLVPENVECSLLLVSINGQVVKELKFNGNQKQVQLETGDLVAGNYVLVLKKGNKIFSKKVIVL